MQSPAVGYSPAGTGVDTEVRLIPCPLLLCHGHPRTDSSRVQASSSNESCVAGAPVARSLFPLSPDAPYLSSSPLFLLARPLAAASPPSPLQLAPTVTPAIPPAHVPNALGDAHGMHYVHDLPSHSFTHMHGAPHGSLSLVLPHLRSESGEAYGLPSLPLPHVRSESGEAPCHFDTTGYGLHASAVYLLATPMPDAVPALPSWDYGMGNAFGAAQHSKPVSNLVTPPRGVHQPKTGLHGMHSPQTRAPSPLRFTTSSPVALST